MTNPLQFLNSDLEDLETILKLAEVTEDDIDEAITKYNEDNPETAGILEAEIKE